MSAVLAPFGSKLNFHSLSFFIISGNISCFDNPETVLINMAQGPINIGAIMNIRGQVAYEFMFARSLSGVDLEFQGAHLDHVALLLDNNVITLPQIKTIPLTLHNLCETHRQMESQTTIGKVTLEF